MLSFGKKFLGWVVLLAACAPGAAAQQRPLLTEDVDIVPTGTVRIGVGIDFFQGAKFPASGLTGDLTRVGVVDVAVGFSPNVSFEVSGVLQNVLGINSRSRNPAIPLSLAADANSANDTGDFSLATKIKLRKETQRGPSVGFKFGVELPNSDESRGIGLNQTNAFGMVLAGKKFGKQQRLNLFGNLGIGILTAPTRLFTQNDVLLYGLAGIYRVNDRINLVSEINGRASTRKGTAPLGTESLSQARLGLQVTTSGLRFDVAGSAGLTRQSPRSGVIFGVTYNSPDIFKPVQ
jgi:hypothetical protein